MVSEPAKIFIIRKLTSVVDAVIIKSTAAPTVMVKAVPRPLANQNSPIEQKTVSY